MNIFERAARRKLRFSTNNGELSTETLFDLPLTHPTKLNLNSIGLAIMQELKDLGELSLVETKPDPRKALLELRLEIVKHIIASKQADEAAAETRAKRAALRSQLTEVLASKESEALKSLSVEDIRKKLEELGDDSSKQSYDI